MHFNQTMARFFHLCILTFLIAVKSFSATTITIDGAKFTVNGEDKNDVQLNEIWRFAIGDNLDWAKPNFDYSKWDTVYMPLTLEEFFSFGYKGNIWLRGSFEINKEGLDNTYSLLIKQYGASEIYIDGKLIEHFGKVSNSLTTEESYNPQNIPVNFKVDSAGIHHIAIRFSNHAFLSRDDDEAYLNAFNLQIIETSNALTIQKLRVIKESILYSIGIGLFLALGALNFIMFLFYKRDKTNLFYSLFCIALAITFITQVIQNNTGSATTVVILDRLNIFFVLISNFFLLALVYSFIYTKMPKRLWVIGIISFIGALLIIPEFDLAELTNNLLNLYCVIDIIVIVIITYFKRYDPTKKKRRRLLFILASLGIIACLGLFIHKLISIIIFALLVLIIVLPIAGLIFIVPIYMTIRHARGFAVTNKNLEEQLIQVKELSAKTIEQEKERKKILEEQNEKLEELVQERTFELAEKNHEITDSINYARRIQQAILPKHEEIKATLNNYFILFKPKDIVSGDFYFYEKKGEAVILAAADCTGHGVPGALMSMIGSEKLMGAVSESIEPSTILQLLNKGIKSSLRQSDSDDSTRDGMDIALISINVKTNEIKYAGANRPIWIIKSKSKEVQEIKATKKAIGGLTPDDQFFEQHTIQLNLGDTFYLFSDGYADQFGSGGKKLMTKKFREILLSTQDLPMHEQKNYLHDFIENWKKDVEQVDDILVIGVQL